MILWLICGLLVATIIFFVLKWYYMVYKYYSMGVHKMEGPRPIPLLGNALMFISLKNEELLPFVSRMCEEYKGRVAIFMAFIPSIIVADYKLTEFIMSSNTITKKARNYRTLTAWLAEGLLLSNGEKWRKRRKMITPAFHFQILEQFCDVFNGASVTLVTQLSKEIDNGNKSIDIYPFITLCTLDIICETAMGTKINAQIVKQSKYISSVKEISRISILRVQSALHHFDQTYYFTSEARIEKECIKILHAYTDSIIRARRTELLNKESCVKQDENENGTVDGVKRKCAFLDMLLQSTIDGKPLSNEDIREEVDTFMFEGHDTTSSAITFALFSIAQYPEIQAKLLKEQQELFGADRNRPATYADLTNMKYMDLVIKETLRLYPSVPLIGREVTDDFEYDGMTFKKGMDIAIYIYGIHRNPKYFPDPEKFDPERFNKNSYLGTDPYAYIPFAAGPRNCIGQKFAMLEMKSTISTVLRHFKLLPVVPAHSLQLVPETILKSSNGVLVQIEKRLWT